MSDMPAFLKDHLVEPRGQPQAAEITDTTPVLERWSFSDWSTFQDCPYLLYLNKVLAKKYNTLFRPAGKAAVRGNGIHNLLEYSLTHHGKRYDGTALDFMPEFKDTEFEGLLKGMTADSVPQKGYDRLDGYLDQDIFMQPEKRYNIAEDWTETDYESRWLSAIIDGLHLDHERNQAIVLDWKTGGKYVTKHTKQGSLYAAVIHHLFPDMDIEVRFVYLDKPQTDDLVINYKHDSTMLQKVCEFWDEQGHILTTASKKDFAPAYDFEEIADLPPFHMDVLMDPRNYPDPDFPKPGYIA